MEKQNAINATNIGDRFMWKLGDWLRISITVSYTHLDVYKRQVLK